MKRLPLQKMAALCFLMMTGIIGCRDDSTGPDLADAPSLPDIVSEEAQPDLSFFEQNQPKTTPNKEMMADTSNYYAARNAALASAGYFAMHSYYGSFITPADSKEPEFKDDKWVWKYSYTYEGATGEWRLTAEEVPAGYSWALFLSYDDGAGNGYENYKVLEGTSSADGSEGDWTFNDLNRETKQETKFYTASWVIDSDIEKEMSFKLFDEGVASVQGTYLESQPEYTVSWEFSDRQDLLIYLNTEKKTGYIQRGTEKKCWDENFVNTSCS